MNWIETKQSKTHPFQGPNSLELGPNFLDLPIGHFVVNFMSLYCFDDPVVNSLSFTVASMVACYYSFSSENNDMIVICACTFKMCGTHFNLTSWSRGIIFALALPISSQGEGRIMEFWRSGSWEPAACCKWSPLWRYHFGPIPLFCC